MSFTFNLTAPSTEGEWHLIAVNRVWWQNAWYLDPNGGALPFNITISNALTLTLSALGANTQVSLDGSQYQLNNGASVTLAVQPGKHNISAPILIQGLQGERFVLVGWSDGLSSSSRPVLVSQDSKLQAIYRTEYYLSVKSDFGQTAGSGWYESGAEPSFAVGPSYVIPVQSKFLADEYRFAGWSGDSNSSSQVASVMMNGSKSIEAVWTRTSTVVDLTLPTYIFFAGSILLAGTAIIRYSIRRSSRRFSGRASRTAMKLLVLIAIVLVSSMALPSTSAAPIQPKVSIVKIADAQWYYWNQPQSDTCILWLGGGIFDESIEGYYSYWINPFDYESFGTVRFIQDLAKYYCLIGLENGSAPAFNPTANRTIHQELIQSQSTVLAHVHDWVRQQGYQHTYLVGYSVGGQAAAMEAAHTDSEGWTSQDGLILITVPLATTIIQSAHELHANLMFLYGGNLPDYEATGQKFYDNAPTEGWHRTSYFHKEFHVLEDAGHEVWTIRQTGEYDPTALNLVVSFIEKSKGLQYGVSGLTVENSTAPANTPVTISSVQAPNRVPVSEPFVADINASYDRSPGLNATLIAYDVRNSSILSAETLSPHLAGTQAVRLVMPPFSNASQVRLLLLVIIKSGETWVESSKPYPTNVTVTNLVKVTIKTSIPNDPVLLDGASYETDVSGILEVETTRGWHSFQVSPYVYFNNVSRGRFVAWGDSTNDLSKKVALDSDMTLTALYSKQYFVNASSPYATTTGTGWYDENATATVTVSPPIISQLSLIFKQWLGDSNENTPRVLLTVDSPKEVTASWSPLSAPNSPGTNEITWLAVSIVLFCVLLGINLSLSARTRKQKLTSA